MPISMGARGLPGILAIPGRVFVRGEGGMAVALSVPRRRVALGEGGMYSGAPGVIFRSPKFSTTNAIITGITKDSTGATLGSCVVQLFRTVDDVFMLESVSDGAGAYTLTAIGSGPFYIVAYKAGAPDAAGTTVNTLSAD